MAEAIAASQRCGSRRLGEWPVTMLGFLEFSLGNYEAAIETVKPLMPNAGGGPGLDGDHQRVLRAGRRRGVDPLGQARRGRADGRGCSSATANRLDRPWMKAVGARCRAMLLAAQGDVDGRQPRCRAGAHRARPAADAVRTCPHPAARRSAAAQAAPKGPGRNDSAGGAEDIRGLNIRLWADRARAELARADVGTRRMSSASARPSSGWPSWRPQV